VHLPGTIVAVVVALLALATMLATRHLPPVRRLRRRAGDEGESRPAVLRAKSRPAPPSDVRDVDILRAEVARLRHELERIRDSPDRSGPSAASRAEAYEHLKRIAANALSKP
jgi:hypothetical protein